MGKDITFDKLKGRENYAQWELNMLAFLRTRDLIKCVKADPNTETNEDKLERALSRLRGSRQTSFRKRRFAIENLDDVTHNFRRDGPGFEVERSRRFDNNKFRGL